ncbi:hypothetical protein HYT04_03020 [Candidatus Kaiserbacteria bacterium]|nr:hypothetical protein [Candidatus Kaiserbacteria bacterium]
MREIEGAGDMSFQNQRPDSRSASIKVVMRGGLAPGLKLAPDAQALFKSGVSWSLAELDRLIDLRARNSDRAMSDASLPVDTGQRLDGGPEVQDAPES